MSDTGSDSWMQIRVSCKSCDMSFENEAFLSEHHTKVHATLEELGIKRLPIYSKRIKQKFTGLEINEEGSIVLDESEEEYVAKNDEGLIEKNTCLKRNLLKRKVAKDNLVTNKKTKPDPKQNPAFYCHICKISLSRKDSLNCHNKKLHGYFDYFLFLHLNFALNFFPLKFSLKQSPS